MYKNLKRTSTRINRANLGGVTHTLQKIMARGHFQKDKRYQDKCIHHNKKTTPKQGINMGAEMHNIVVTTPLGTMKNCGNQTNSEETELMKMKQRRTNRSPWQVETLTPLHPIEIAARAAEAGKTFIPSRDENSDCNDYDFQPSSSMYSDDVNEILGKRKAEQQQVKKDAFKQRKGQRIMVGRDNRRLLCDACEEGDDCEWEGVIGQEMKNYAEILETEESTNNQIRFHLYLFYVSSQHAPSAKGLRVPLPWCVELAVKEEYPGNGMWGYSFFKKAKAAHGEKVDREFIE
jgi:hypothetical protein